MQTLLNVAASEVSVIKITEMLITGESSLIRDRVIPIDKPFIYSQDAWTIDNDDDAYKTISIITEADSNNQLQTQYDRKIQQHLRVSQQKKSCPWKVPWVAIVISIIQIFFFFYDDKKLFRILIYSPYRKNEIWRFFTYCLLHSDIVHLLVNIFLQIITAFALETEQGHCLVLLTYIGGVIAGSFGTSIFQKELLIVGSSAGVYCLLLSHVPHLILNFSTLPYRYYRIVSVFVLCLNDVLLTTMHCVNESNVQPKIGLAAHVSGGLSGLALGFALYSGERTASLKLLRLLSTITYGVFVILTIMLNLK